MTDTYTIYLQNQSAEPQNFWCFLAPPEALSDDPGVFANSSASITVVPHYHGTADFVIPVQYIVDAAASNHPVGLAVTVEANYSDNASLGDVWDATYSNAPPNQGPTLLKASNDKSKNISIVTNAFNRLSNERAGWFSSQTFGIETEAGFIGMTWSPDPGQTRTLTPELTFYVSVGKYGANKLAHWDQVSNTSATISAPSSFDDLNKCTVTYTQSGGWLVSAGPPVSLAFTKDLSFLRSQEHHELMAIAYMEAGDVTKDTLVSVKWEGSMDSMGEGRAVGITHLTGTVTVATALGAAFTFFFLNGVRFAISGNSAGARTFRFSYEGDRAAASVKGLFKAGAQLIFGGSS
jgi:hypothetical protein